MLWPTLPLPMRHLLPACPGVYCARPWFGLGRPIYIGMSMNLRERWAGKGHHRLRDLPWHTSLCYLRCEGWGAEDVRHYEAWLIRQMRPRLNGAQVRRAGLWKQAANWMR